MVIEPLFDLFDSAFVIEDVLLENARVLAEFGKNIFAVEVLINRPLNPNVDGCTIHAVIGEQCDAICNLVADAVNQLEFLD